MKSLALLLIVGGTAADAQFFEEEEVFARGDVRGWNVAAATLQVVDSDPPRIRDILCAAVNQDMHLLRYRNGAIKIDLRDSGGDRHSVLNIDRLRIGEREYAARAISVQHSSEFLNVDYPERSDIVLSSFRGYLGIGLPQDVWLPVDYFIGDFLSGARVSVRYRSASRSETWTRIDTAGLGAAMIWCDRAISSDAARQLNRSGS